MEQSTPLDDMELDPLTPDNSNITSFLHVIRRPAGKPSYLQSICKQQYAGEKEDLSF